MTSGPDHEPGVPPPEAPPGTGVRLLSGRYRLGHVLGYGGMAEVYQARDTRLERDVAVKLLRSDLARDPTFQARFRREAQSAAALNHPAIVAVYDTGADDRHSPPLPYIVMEYVAGQTLREVIQTGGRVTPDRAIEITMGVCEALAYSHRSGIVHRDIKPGNVMVTPDGSIKVMDFGIARAVAQSTSTVTQTAAVMGTAQYLSPEQARGEKVDVRSDLYSAGVVLYELLTGEPPFQGDSPVAVAYQHVREAAVPPTDREPALTDGKAPARVDADELDAVVMKALAKNPANRYQTADEMRDDLGRLLTGRKVLATPLLREPDAPGAARRRSSPRRRRRRTVLVTCLLVVLAVLAVSGGLLLARSSKGDDRVAVPPLRNLTLAAAQRSLQENDLQVSAVAVRNAAAEGTVLSTDPQVGTMVPKRTVVRITYSSGPGLQPIPTDLVGLSPDEAKQRLRALGFSTSTTPVQAPTIEVGRVASTSPAGGAMADPRSVTVMLNVADNETTVPLVQGFFRDGAVDLLRAASLQVSILETPSQSPDGTVLTQDLPQGSVVDRGTTVTLTVSRQVTPTPTPTPSTGPTTNPAPSSVPPTTPSAAPTPERPTGPPSKPRPTPKPKPTKDR